MNGKANGPHPMGRNWKKRVLGGVPHWVWAAKDGLVKTMKVAKDGKGKDATYWLLVRTDDALLTTERTADKAGLFKLAADLHANPAGLNDLRNLWA